jgi:hypothetical protein
LYGAGDPHADRERFLRMNFPQLAEHFERMVLEEAERDPEIQQEIKFFGRPGLTLAEAVEKVLEAGREA